MTKTKVLSIIIPVYNEEKYISKTILQVVNSNSLGFKKEIIIIDDGSTDTTYNLIKEFVKSINYRKMNVTFNLIKRVRNEGKGAALRSGFLKSTGDIVLVQDSDLEYSPDDYSVLLEPFIKNNADVVYGSRFISQKPHRVLYFWHFLGNSLLTTLSNILTNINLTDMETGFKVFKGKIIRNLAKHLQSDRFGFEPEITAKISKIKDIKIYEVGISYWGRTYKEGKKINWKDGVKTIWQIIRFNLFSN